MNDSPKFYYQRLIPFHYTDAAGILFFAHVFTLANEALEHFVIEKLNFTWNDWFNNKDWIAPIKECKASFLKPIFGGQNCDIFVTLEAISTSSITFHYHFFQTGVQCCEVQVLYVFCNKNLAKPLQKMAIPDDVRSRLEK